MVFEMDIYYASLSFEIVNQNSLLFMNAFP